MSQVGHVPDTGHTRLIALCAQDNESADVVLTSEAEGPGLVLGATLGGDSHREQRVAVRLGAGVSAARLLAGAATGALGQRTSGEAAAVAGDIVGHWPS